MIPILRPQLPSAQELLPYLERIDANRMYSNHGPLVLELEQKLTDLIAIPGLKLVSAASGTAALVGAVLGTAGRATAERPFALCPSYTYIGTISALEQCGYIPWFVDINRDTWQIEAQALLEHPRLNEVGVVMPVAPYGRCVEITAWENFQDITGIQVVVDAAAGIEGIVRQPQKYLSQIIPVVMSFHATKPLSTGEGGGVICQESTRDHIARALNFGIWGSRLSQSQGVNGKMSEYHAAVGLAFMDSWRWQPNDDVVNFYNELVERLSWPADVISSPDIASSYVLLQTKGDNADIESWLVNNGFSYRYWYEQGVHLMPQYSDYHHYFDPLVYTEMMSRSLLGVPNCIPDLA